MLKIFLIGGVMVLIAGSAFYLMVIRRPAEKVTQGIYGNVVEQACPGAEPISGENRCSTFPLQTKVYIVKPTAIRNYADLPTTEILYTVDTDKNGHFEVQLPEGDYTAMIESKNGQYSCNDGARNINCTFKIQTTDFLQLNLKYMPLTM